MIHKRDGVPFHKILPPEYPTLDPFPITDRHSQCPSFQTNILLDIIMTEKHESEYAANEFF